MIALWEFMLKLPSDRGPFCQSCGMPLTHPYDFGTAADDTRVNDYCTFCYDHGHFRQPALTPEQMVEQSVTFLTRQTFMAEAEARALASGTIPRLKRWQTPGTP